MKEWYLNSNFHKSEHMEEFLLAALTYIFLQKFGGTVLSFDILLRKRIGSKGPFLSRCRDDDIVELYPITIELPITAFVQDLMEQMSIHFNVDEPESIGSRLITRRLSELCGVNYIKDLEYKVRFLVNFLKICPKVIHLI